MQQAILLVPSGDSSTTGISNPFPSFWTTHDGHKLLMGFQWKQLFSFILYNSKRATVGRIMDSSWDVWKLSQALGPDFTPLLHRPSFIQLPIMS